MTHPIEFWFDVLSCAVNACIAYRYKITLNLGAAILSGFLALAVALNA